MVFFFPYFIYINISVSISLLVLFIESCCCNNIIKKIWGEFLRGFFFFTPLLCRFLFLMSFFSLFAFGVFTFFRSFFFNCTKCVERGIFLFSQRIFFLVSSASFYMKKRMKQSLSLDFGCFSLSVMDAKVCWTFECVCLSVVLRHFFFFVARLEEKKNTCCTLTRSSFYNSALFVRIFSAISWFYFLCEN